MTAIQVKNTNEFPLVAIQALGDTRTPLAEIAPGEEVEVTFEDGSTLAIKAKEEEAAGDDEKQAA